MDSQKPAKEMLDKAHKLAFFADEVLSQKILDSHEALADYIRRNEQRLIDSNVIKPKKTAPVFTKEEMKLRGKLFTKLYWKASIIPFLLFALFSWFILSYSQNWSVFHSWVGSVLSYWPNAQTWSNRSPEFREKMILLYGLYKITLVYFFLSISAVVIKNRTLFSHKFVPLKCEMCKKTGLMFIALLAVAGYVIAVLAGVWPIGSPTPLGVEQLDNSQRFFLSHDSIQWNNLYGVIFANLGFNLIASSYAILVSIQAIATIKWCSKYA